MNITNQDDLSLDVNQLKQLILMDIKERVDKFETDNPSLDVYSEFSIKCKLNSNTLRIWIKNQSLPYPRSIENFYLNFCGLNYDSFPSFVQEYFKLKNYSYQSQFKYIDCSNIFRGNPIHQEIFRWLDCGEKLSEDSIRFKYSKAGLNALNDLVKEGIVSTKIKDDIKLTNIRVLKNEELYAIFNQNNINRFPIERYTVKSEHNLENGHSNIFSKVKKEDFDKMMTEIINSTQAITEKYEEKAEGSGINTSYCEFTMLGQLNSFDGGLQ